MKRRLTFSILGVVAATLVLAGVGTLLFARVGARNASELELRSQAESTAELVGVGQTRFAGISNDLERFFCEGDPTNLSDRQVAAFNRARTTICSSPDQVAVADAVSRLCSDTAERLGNTFSGNQVNEKRKAFCANANAKTLQTFQDAFCGAAPNNPDGRLRNQIARAKRSLCVRRAAGQQSDNLEATLSKEEILLVEFDADNTLADGQRLPEDIDPSLIDVDRLRGDETVSGSVGSNVFAVAPVDAPASQGGDLRAIVIERPANPINDSVQWFLMAAGLTLALGAVVSWLLGRALTHPLRQATEVTKRIADGDLSSRLPEHPARAGEHLPRDDLNELAHSINSMADSLERSRGLERQFLLSVSHDLRTPLTSIRGYAEAIADGAAPDPQRAAAVIMGESRRLERLVKDLLDLAKLESRGFELTVSPIDITDVADDSVEGFRREAESAGLRILMRDATGLPVMAMADADRLQQVIANLIENALKYASTTIAVSVVGGTSGPRVEVADDGPGIAPEDLPHVFERLYVASHEPKRKETGSGLGLAIVRELVDLMGGSVRAEANPTGGARMVVLLARVPDTTLADQEPIPGQAYAPAKDEPGSEIR